VTARGADDDVAAGDLSLSMSDFGGVGLLQTRTARFHQDGQFDFGVSFVDPYIRYYLTWAIVPWAEATFRYTDIRNQLFSDVQSFSGDQTFKDRGADVKFKLMTEGRYRPQIAVGLQDGLGTGQFQGEYLVASKRWYDFDFSLGMGWGYFASGSSVRNPLALFSDRFNRRVDIAEQGGTFRVGNYFAGRNVGIFGGVEWRTPIEGLTLKIEYDTNDYQNEPLGNKFKQDLPINVGANWRPYPFVDLSLGIERGNTAMFRVALRANLHDSGPAKADPPPAPIKPRPPAAAEFAALEPSQPWWEELGPARRGLCSGWLDSPPPAAAQRASPGPAGDAAAQLFDSLEREGVEIEAVELSRTDATITVSRLGNGRVVALHRVAQAVVSALADPLERVTVVETAAGREMRRLTVETRDVAEAAIVDYVFDGFEAAGLPVESVELSETEAVIAVAAPRGLNGASAAGLVARVLDAVPMPVGRVTILARQAGRETGRISITRDEARREARLDRLFAALRSSGVEPLSIDLSHHVATLEVTPTGKTPDLQALGRAVIDALPTPLEAVTVVALADGREIGRATYEPFAPRVTVAAGNELPAAPPLVPDAAKRKIAEGLLTELDGAGFRALAFDVDTRGATVWVTPTKYRQVSRNIGRAARIVAISVMRKELEKAVALKGSTEEVFATAALEGGERSHPAASAVQKPGMYPNLDWGLRPALIQSVGQPEQFYLYQLNARLTARVDWGHGFGTEFAGDRKLFGTLDKARTDSTATLPHVRSDVRQYVIQGETSLERLAVDYRFKPAKDWYARMSGGIFESMFGGAGGEVLYWPYGWPVALGAELFYAQQREFNQRFGFRDYNVVTGFVNMYWQVPWYNLLAQVSVGRYLAGDKGATFRLQREFDSGIRVGAFATLTDVPFDVFGEGSFDKGFFISIPFETVLTTSTQRGGTFLFRPLTKDGGQMLTGAGQSLYGIVAGDNNISTVREWRRLLE
jgi:hypothetical protein